jgi:hypothetical protein
MKNKIQKKVRFAALANASLTADACFTLRENH